MRHLNYTMKKIVFFTILSSLLIACGGDTKNTMTVTGKVKGLKKGILYLQSIPDSTLVTIDSLEVDGDGSFEFKTEVVSPEIFYLYLKKEDNNEINDRIRFFGEPGNISINTTWNSFDSKAQIEGSETQKKYEEYLKVMSRFNTRDLEIVNSAVKAGIKFDSIQRDSILNLSDKNLKRSYSYAINFALTNKDSYIAPFIALQEIPDANRVYLDSIYNSITPEVAESKYGLALKEYLDKLRKSQ